MSVTLCALGVTTTSGFSLLLSISLQQLVLVSLLQLNEEVEDISFMYWFRHLASVYLAERAQRLDQAKDVKRTSKTQRNPNFKNYPYTHR